MNGISFKSLALAMAISMLATSCHEENDSPSGDDSAEGCYKVTTTIGSSSVVNYFYFDKGEAIKYRDLRSSLISAPGASVGLEKVDKTEDECDEANDNEAASNGFQGEGCYCFSATGATEVRNYYYIENATAYAARVKAWDAICSAMKAKASVIKSDADEDECETKGEADKYCYYTTVKKDGEAVISSYEWATAAEIKALEFAASKAGYKVEASISDNMDEDACDDADDREQEKYKSQERCYVVTVKRDGDVVVENYEWMTEAEAKLLTADYEIMGLTVECKLSDIADEEACEAFDDADADDGDACFFFKVTVLDVSTTGYMWSTEENMANLKKNLTSRSGLEFSYSKSSHATREECRAADKAE